tara:strand:+ start:76 stop:807 length:732 start_codon:yes stop_codon:yes gene_type:complete
MAYLKHIEYNEGVNVARGLVRGAYSVNKFGYNPSVPSNAFETAWDGSNLYTYISTPGTATITSSNAGDNGGTVQVFGLDSNYNLVDETLTIGGAAGSVVFKRVFRAVMITATTGTANVGTITVTVDSKSAAIISIGYGQSLMALYTVPADHTAYLMQIDASSQKDLENQIQLVVRNGTSGHVWQTKEFLSVRGGFNSKEYRLPVKINQKHDIEVRVKSSATSAVSAGFELLVIQDTFVESRRA